MHLVIFILFFFVMTNLQAQVITSDFSGSWFNEATNGQGFQLQVVDDQTVLAFWYTYDDTGNPIWAFGVGSIEGNQVSVEMSTAAGPTFSDYNPEDVLFTPFGTVTFTFVDCNAADVAWQTSLAAFGSGSMPIIRLTNNADASCTGGVSDNTRQTDGFLDIEFNLTNNGIFPAGQAEVDYQRSATRTKFDVELEDVPTGDYQLRVDGVEQGTISVVMLSDRTRGEIEFSSPRDDNERLLDFEPLDQQIDILQDGTVLFSGILDSNTGSNGSPLGDLPLGEIEVDLINTGEIPLGSGDAKYEGRADRVEFDVEIEDVPVGNYDLFVGGNLEGQINVQFNAAANRNEGEIEFRNPVDAGSQLLTFNPLGQEISIRDNGVELFRVNFPTQP